MGQSKSKMLSPDAISVKKKGFLYYLKRDWQLYALLLLPMAFIIVFKYFAYTGLSVAFLDYKIGKGYAGSKFVGLNEKNISTWHGCCHDRHPARRLRRVRQLRRLYG